MFERKETNRIYNWVLIFFSIMEATQFIGIEFSIVIAYKKQA